MAPAAPALSPPACAAGLQEARDPCLTRLRFRVLLSSSGIGRYTARATQLAKMVNKMIVSKGLVPRLRRVFE